MIRDLAMRIAGSVLDRRSRWRLGRAVYMEARTDGPNDMRRNGEAFLVDRLLAAQAAAGRPVVLFDVGANVGEWTAHAIEAHRSAAAAGPLSIHAFEPVDTTFARLERRVEDVRGEARVTLERKALSDRTGSSEMFVHGDGLGTNSLHSAGPTDDGRTATIELTTFDRYCEGSGIDRVHYVKCDTEGHEMSVLRGARRMIEGGRVGVFQFEYNHRWVYSRHYLKDAFDFADGTPYQVGKVVPDGIERFDAWHPELERFFEGNYALVHPEARDWVPVHDVRVDRANTYDRVAAADRSEGRPEER